GGHKWQQERCRQMGRCVCTRLVTDSERLTGLRDPAQKTTAGRIELLEAATVREPPIRNRLLGVRLDGVPFTGVPVTGVPVTGVPVTNEEISGRASHDVGQPLTDHATKNRLVVLAMEHLECGIEREQGL